MSAPCLQFVCKCSCCPCRQSGLNTGTAVAGALTVIQYIAVFYRVDKHAPPPLLPLPAGGRAGAGAAGAAGGAERRRGAAAAGLPVPLRGLGQVRDMAERACACAALHYMNTRKLALCCTGPNCAWINERCGTLLLCRQAPSRRRQGPACAAPRAAGRSPPCRTVWPHTAGKHGRTGLFYALLPAATTSPLHPTPRRRDQRVSLAELQSSLAPFVPRPPDELVAAAALAYQVGRCLGYQEYC